MSPDLFDISRVEDLVTQGRVLLTPNQRLARAIRGAWDTRMRQRGFRAWEPLAVFSLEDWLQERWRIAVRQGGTASGVVLSREQELLLWQQVIAQRQEAAVGGGALIHAAAAAELASQARDRLLRWEIPLHDPAVRQRFRLESDCNAFAEWLSDFDARLNASGWLTAADCLRALAEARPSPGPVQVALVSVDELAPLEQRCLERLGEGIARAPESGDDAETVVHPFPEQRRELAAAAAWARQLHGEQPASTVGIVLADTGEQRVALDYLLRREFDCLGEDYYSLPVNFSTGIGLSRAPAVRDALAVLGTTGDSISVPQVVDLLHSRFLRLPDAGSPLAGVFIRELYNRGSEQVAVASLRNLATTIRDGDREGLALGNCLLEVSSMRQLRGRHMPSAWAGLFTQVLDTWGWPGAQTLDSLEYQQVSLWYQTLDRFRALDGVCGAVDAAEALRILRQVCERQVSHPQTRDSRIQVLGPLEAVGLCFDHLWICGMQGGAWPSPPRPNPFIPLAIQATAGMPHATPEREWQFSQTLLGQYRHACGTVHASYSKQVNGAPELPSGLLAGFTEQALDVGHEFNPAWPVQRAAARAEQLRETCAPALQEDELADLRGGSAIVEHQSQCPFRAFAEHRLGARLLPDFVIGISAPERGALVHEALQYLWTQIDSHEALLAQDGAARRSLVQAAAEAGTACLHPARRAALGHTCIALETERLEALLEQWLEVERARGAFAVQALEQPVRLSLSRLEISLRVDRIDTLADGGRVVIDYKTGKAAVKDWLGERPARPQLLLYGLAVDALPAAISFAQVRPDECEYVGIGVTDSIPGLKTDMAKLARGAPAYEDWESLNATWRNTLEQLAQAFVDGEAQVDPLPGSCQWCGLQGICRIDTAAGDGASGDDDHDGVNAGGERQV